MIKKALPIVMQRKLRERAREDLKKKRTAPYLTTDPLATTSLSGKNRLFHERKSGQPTAPFQKENPGELLKYSKRLRQDQLILARVQNLQFKNPRSGRTD